MRLDARARAVGRKVADERWIVALRNLVDHAPVALGDVEVEVGDTGDLLVTVGSDLLRPHDAGWWRELEVQLADFLAGAEPEEAGIVAGVLDRLPWHPRKRGLQRRLEERAYGYAMPPEARRAPPEPRRRATG